MLKNVKGVNVTNKEIDKLVETKVKGNHKIYDLRRELKVVEKDISLEAAKAIIEFHSDNEKIYYTITTSPDIPAYSEDIKLALQVASDLIARNQDKEAGFLFSYFPNEGWRATFGNIEDCVEAFDSKSASKAICLAALKYIGAINDEVANSPRSQNR